MDYVYRVGVTTVEGVESDFDTIAEAMAAITALAEQGIGCKVEPYAVKVGESA